MRYDLPETLSRDDLNEAVRKGQAGDKGERERAILSLVRVGWKAAESWVSSMPWLEDDIRSLATQTVIESFPFIRVKDGSSCTPYVYRRVRWNVYKWCFKGTLRKNESMANFSAHPGSGDHDDTTPCHGGNFLSGAVVDDSPPVDHESRDLAAIAIKRLDTIPPKQAEVLKSYFGLDGRRPKTEAEIGRENGYSRSRASRIVRRGIMSLRGNLNHLDSFRGVA